MPTANDVIDYALTLLAQAANSIAGGLPLGGMSGSWEIDPTAQLLLWATEAQERLARLCVPIPDIATVTPAVAGQTTIAPYGSLISPGGRTMHTVIDVYIGNPPDTRLIPGQYGQLNAWYPPDFAGNPTAYANINSAIVASPYTTQPLFTIDGFFLPAELTALDQTLDPYLDDLCRIAMADYIAWRVAEKNQDNAVLAQRAMPRVQDYANVVKEIYTRMVANDSSLSPYFSPQAIDSQVAAMYQKVLKT